MVKEFQHGRSQDLLLAVDLWLPGPELPTRGRKKTQAEQQRVGKPRDRQPRAEASDVERVELAISFAASICVDHMQSATDSMVDLVVCGRETQRASAGSGVASMGGLLERLALVQAGPADGLARAIREAADSAPGQLRRVLITTRPRAAFDAALVANDNSNERFDLSDFEIIEADPRELTAWLEFDLADSGGAA
jgi:hypothetical protein